MTREGEEGKGEAAVLILLSTNTEMKWYIVWQGTSSTNKWNLSCYSLWPGTSLICSVSTEGGALQRQYMQY